MEEIYWIWLSRIEKLNSTKKELLLKRYKNPYNIWKMTEIELKKIQELNEVEILDILNIKYRRNNEKYLEYMRKNKIMVITLFDKNYPSKLKNIYDKPIVLFAKGNIELLNKKSIAIVGSRNCSDYGKRVSEELAYNLAKNNICIISGLAIGIDKYAHIGSIQANGETIAVIGNGIDYFYPYENKYLSELIVEKKGLIITEYIIGTKPNRMNFPARNRIISGLSDGIVVVEAGEKSGALITAEFGIEQGKEVFAVPGNIDSLKSVGTNQLIKEGANVVLDYKDITNII